jgi:hypothetical protein
MNQKKKSERHFKKYQAESIFTTDVENFVKDYKSKIPTVKISKRSKAKALVKVINKFINEI